ncbi:MAG: MBL fold metallo-hydrolase [Clostridiales Family XIII bacterium]|jgi:glyoxylase-like metal-dependent hydrolase (beta-lactamase superfamily II)|nr:MBL fold metallo-hydrolase [Clostridiales Family XIII bacterium]
MALRKFTSENLGINCYLLYDDDTREAIIVDPGEVMPGLIDEIDENALLIKYIFLTHGHADHIGGVEELKKMYPGAPVAAGAGEKEILADPGKNLSTLILGRDVSIKPDLELRDGDEMRIGRWKFDVLETPGHSPGGISIYNGWIVYFGDDKYSGLVLSGDTLFKHSIGRTDLYGGDREVLVHSILRKLYILPDNTLVLPGHMEHTSIIDEKFHNPFTNGEYTPE